MIELTDEQAAALRRSDTTPPRIVNPRTHEAFVLLNVDEYERLKVDVRNRIVDQQQRRQDGDSGMPVLPRRLGTLRGSIVSIRSDFDDVPEGFEEYLP